MEGRMKKNMQTSPERAIVWMEPSQKRQNRQVAVVYYLCRNHHLEHPHFIEVPLSSPEGLYLRDVINRLTDLRGRGMPSLYSWSCKRSYKNGFVWHDLCEDDLILPAHGNEYVLKGSEIFEESPSGRLNPSSNLKLLTSKPLQEPTSSRRQNSSSTSLSIVKKGKRPSHEDDSSPPLRSHGSTDTSPESRSGKNPSCGSGNGSGSSSTSLIEYKVHKGDGAADAATQTEDSARKSKAQETCTRGVSTDDGSSEVEHKENNEDRIRQAKDKSELCRDEISPPPSSSSPSSGGKAETLESLMKADAGKMNSFRILDEEELRTSSNTKVKASNVLMQLISCGSISVKDHSFGFIPTYRPRFSHSRFPSPLFSNTTMLGELDCLSENPRMMGLRLEDKEYFSGSLIEIKTNSKGEGFAALKRSSSYNADRTCNKPLDSVGEKEEPDSTRSKCIPLSVKASLCKQLKSETMKSPVSEGPKKSSAGADSSQSTSLSSSTTSSKRITNMSNPSSKRITEPPSSRKHSKRLDSFREDEKVVKIEENLLLELGLLSNQLPFVRTTKAAFDLLSTQRIIGYLILVDKQLPLY